MKQQVSELISAAIQRLIQDGVLDAASARPPQVDRTKDVSHGDFSTNAAMVMAKAARSRPRDLAIRLTEAMPQSELIEKVDIAGPGFINFHLAPSAYRQLVPQILEAGHDYGRSRLGAGKRVQVEFVSANPTGPLHVGHGRGAAYGAVVADLLAAVGFDVHREYYVNDAGRQMDILATSVWLRYLELCDEGLRFPANGYRGDYVWDIAATLHRDHGDAYQADIGELFAGVPEDSPNAEEQKSGGGPGGDKEAHIDGLIGRA